VSLRAHGRSPHYLCQCAHCSGEHCRSISVRPDAACSVPVGMSDSPGHRR
jgi:hypothetical protein